MTVSTNAPRAAIIGGGLIGLSCAFELARRGAVVTVLEAGHCGGAASGAAAGMLAPGAEAVGEGGPDAYSRFCLNSLRQWPDFIDAIQAAGGPRISLRADGSLLIASSLEEAERLAENLIAQGQTAEALDSEAVARRQPGLAGLPGALWLPEESHLDPRQAVTALRAALETMGVRVVEDRPVRRLETKDGHVSALVHDRGAEPCDFAVIACGGGADLRGQVPALSALTPVKGQMSALGGVAHGLRCVVRGEVYMIPRSQDEVWIGASVEPGRSDTKVEDGVIAGLRAKAEALYPALSGMETIRRWAGARPGTRDGFPLIGESGIRGAYLAAGHYRNGILAAPATARAIADLALDRVSAPLLDSFSPGRIELTAA